MSGKIEDTTRLRQSKMYYQRKVFFLLILSALSSTLSGCGPLAGLSDIGQPPELSKIDNPVLRPGHTYVTIPMPDRQKREEKKYANSLWHPSSKSFFKDQRASKVGDILTVKINIEDSGNVNNETERNRESTQEIAAPELLGFQSKLPKVFPKAFNPASVVNLSNKPEHVGKGMVRRNENIKLKVAALITQELPNGNFVIEGRQEVRINFEVREILITGIVRREDILSDNTVNYEKIAEARISYGGRGQLTDVQQPPYGQQFIDKVWPF